MDLYHKLMQNSQTLTQTILSYHNQQAILLQTFMQCPICCESVPILYSISDCDHRFCQNCCMAHIQEKSTLFTDILCPQNGCGKHFNKNPQIYNRLLPKVIENMKKRERFLYLSKNPHMKQCLTVNCTGLVNLKQPQKRCSVCFTSHCPKCMMPFHNPPCLLNQHDRQMRSLNYQKCPSCSVWVQKKQGCNFVDCKCGASFCYSCGVPFADDPCRLQEKWTVQHTLRTQFKNLSFKMPKQNQDKLGFFIKLPLKCFLILILTIIFSIISNLLIISSIALIIILSPIVVLIAACSQGSKLIIVACIIFLPVLSVLVILLTILLFCLYPFIRKTNHHGIYDGFDMGVNYVVVFYLKIIKCIL